MNKHYSTVQRGILSGMLVLIHGKLQQAIVVNPLPKDE